uniref:Uncharacterized protein n=1 Tax=Aegilops tauschii subsp. strangulata TaxID=200361 RepID=A0A453HYD8_AEGTS
MDATVVEESVHVVASSRKGFCRIFGLAVVNWFTPGACRQGGHWANHKAMPPGRARDGCQARHEPFRPHFQVQRQGSHCGVREGTSASASIFLPKFC